MAQWQCDLKVSVRTQRFALLVQGIMLLLVMIIFCPKNNSVFCLVLAALVIVDGIRSQKNIVLCQGKIKLKGGNLLMWKNQEWRIASQPWMMKQGILFSLKQTDSSLHQSLWIASDSMTASEWRHLCLILRQFFYAEH